MLICLLCLSQDDTAGYSSGDNNCEEINGSARQLRSSSLTRDRPSYASSEKFTSPMTVSPPNCFCSSTFYLITWVWRDIYSNFFFDLPKQYISQPQQNFSKQFFWSGASMSTGELPFYQSAFYLIIKRSNYS